MPYQSSEEQCEPQAPPSAFGELTRGASYSRTGSEHLKRRNSSLRSPRHGLAQQQHSSGQANALHTIYSSASMGFPTSPRVASRTLQAKERRARRSSRTKFILGLGIAAGLVALCMLSSYFLPMLSSSHPASPMSSVSPIGLWASSPPRRLLDYSEEIMTAAPITSGQLHDAYTNRHKHHTEIFHASSWDSHMAARMSRQLAEGSTGMAGGTSTGMEATAESPNAGEAGSMGGTSTNSPTGGTQSSTGGTKGMNDGSWSHESTKDSSSSSGASSTTGTASAGGAMSHESTRESSSSGASANAGTASSGSGSAGTAQETDGSASAALSGQFNSYRSVSGVSATSSGSVGGSSGSGSSSGVIDLQQPGTESSSSRLAAGSGTNTLQYSNGYAEIGGDNYKVIQHTQNSDQCAALCASDAACVAWTRVAGGRSDVRSCYLKNSLAGVAGAPEASNSMLQRAQAVNYVDSTKVMLESGTRNPSALPSALYGCPYPSSSNGDCKPPASCNCYQGACYGTC